MRSMRWRTLSAPLITSLLFFYIFSNPHIYIYIYLYLEPLWALCFFMGLYIYICIYFEVYTSFRYTRSTYTQMRQIAPRDATRTWRLMISIESVRDLILKESAWVTRDARLASRKSLAESANLSNTIDLF